MVRGEAQMQPKLVICIPTYNRSEVIADVLGKELSLLAERRVDVILYDSSEGEAAKRVYLDYSAQGYSNLRYVRCDSHVHSNEKVYMIFREMEYSEYDYVWMIHDHKICSKTAIDYILEEIESRKDFYIISKLEQSEFCSTCISDKNVFFQRCAYLLTTYGASIINVKTFIKGTEWEEMKNKYLSAETINFSHIGFYFERAAQLPNFSASLLEFQHGSFVKSKEKEGCSWYNDSVRIWAECWPATILRLPSIYQNKQEVIRSIEAIHFSKKKMIDYRRQGLYDYKVFWQYARWLKLACSETLAIYFFLAILNPDITFNIYKRRFLKKLKQKSKDGKKIVIYGAGKYASECAALLKQEGIFIDAFVVNSLQHNPVSLLGCPVRQAGEYFKSEKEVLILIAVSHARQEEINEYLKSMEKRPDSIWYEG